MVRLINDKAMNRVVSRLPEVHYEVVDAALDVGVKAEAKLASHKKTGRAEVTVTEGDVDAFVNLDDPAAMSIEFGHFVKGKFEGDEPKYVGGLYIITGAAGLTD